jgi:hypothetical protein
VATIDTVTTADASSGTKLRGRSGEDGSGNGWRESGSSHVVGGDGAGFTDIVVPVTISANSYAAVLIATTAAPRRVASE